MAIVRPENIIRKVLSADKSRLRSLCRDAKAGDVIAIFSRLDTIALRDFSFTVQNLFKMLMFRMLERKTRERGSKSVPNMRATRWRAVESSLQLRDMANRECLRACIYLDLSINKLGCMTLSEAKSIDSTFRPSRNFISRTHASFALGY